MPDIVLVTSAPGAAMPRYDWVQGRDYTGATATLDAAAGVTMTVEGVNLRGAAKDSAVEAILLNLPDGPFLRNAGDPVSKDKWIYFEFAVPVVSVGAYVSAFVHPPPKDGEKIPFRIKIEVTRTDNTLVSLGTETIQSSTDDTDLYYRGASSASGDIKAIAFCPSKAVNSPHSVTHLALGPLFYRVAKAGAAGGGGI